MPTECKHRTPSRASVTSKTRRGVLRAAVLLPMALELGGMCAAHAAPPPSQTAAAAVAAALPRTGDGTQTRIALLLGNADYPDPFTLPPAPKNVTDLAAALMRRGFEVSNALNLGLDAARQVVAAFAERARHASADGLLFFYFTGHGAQADAANLLLPAGVSPAESPDTLRDACLHLLRDVVQTITTPPQGLTIAVVDACRTSLLATTHRDASMNQVEAPPGSMIVFSTAAGKPAIAPAVADRDTFFTAALVKLLESESDETSFSDLFQLVRTDVYREMRAYPIPIIRQFAQDPFIADHSFVRVTLGRPSAMARAGQGFGSVSEEQAWKELQDLSVPAQISQAAAAFLSAYPHSKYRAAVKVELRGSRRASAILQRSDIQLYVSDFVLHPKRESVQWMRDVRRAARGDKDAAARLGAAALHDHRDGPERASARYEGWMQFAAALGNGIASYQLALYYREQRQPMLASQFEALALRLGYTPPPTLSNVRR